MERLACLKLPVRPVRHIAAYPLYEEDVAVYVLGRTHGLLGQREKGINCRLYFYQLVSHGFRVESDTPAEFIYDRSAGFGRFVIEQELPAPKSEPEMDAARYKIEILGPLPE
jgi:hypothetical protein